MAKDSFIMYKDQKEIFNNLSDAQAGKLIKAVFEYVDTGQTKIDEKIIKMAFISIKQQIDRNDLKWQEIKEKRILAGRMGGISRALNHGQKLSSKSAENLDIITSSKQSQANQAVNVNVNVNDNIKENIKRKVFVAPSLEDVKLYIAEKQLNVDGQQFYDYFTEGGWKDSKGNQVKNWKQKLLTWNKFNTTSGTKKVERKSNYEQRKYDDFSSFYVN